MADEYNDQAVLNASDLAFPRWALEHMDTLEQLWHHVGAFCAEHDLPIATSVGQGRPRTSFASFCRALDALHFDRVRRRQQLARLAMQRVEAEETAVD